MTGHALTLALALACGVPRGALACAALSVQPPGKTEGIPAALDALTRLAERGLDVTPLVGLPTDAEAFAARGIASRGLSELQTAEAAARAEAESLRRRAALALLTAAERARLDELTDEHLSVLAPLTRGRLLLVLGAVSTDAAARRSQTGEAAAALETFEGHTTAVEALRRVTLAHALHALGRPAADGRTATELFRSVLELPVSDADPARAVPVALAAEALLGLHLVGGPGAPVRVAPIVTRAPFNAPGRLADLAGQCESRALVARLGPDADAAAVEGALAPLVESRPLADTLGRVETGLRTLPAQPPVVRLARALRLGPAGSAAVAAFANEPLAEDPLHLRAEALARLAGPPPEAVGPLSPAAVAWLERASELLERFPGSPQGRAAGVAFAEVWPRAARAWLAEGTLLTAPRAAEERRVLLAGATTAVLAKPDLADTARALTVELLLAPALDRPIATPEVLTAAADAAQRVAPAEARARAVRTVLAAARRAVDAHRVGAAKPQPRASADGARSAWVETARLALALSKRLDTAEAPWFVRQAADALTASGDRGAIDLYLELRVRERDPLARTELEVALGDAYRAVGEFGAALDQYRVAVQALDADPPPGAPPGTPPRAPEFWRAWAGMLDVQSRDDAPDRAERVRLAVKRLELIDPGLGGPEFAERIRAAMNR